LANDRTRKVTLLTPVRPYGQEVTELTIRPPTAKELRECGQPYAIVQGASGGIKADYDACTKLLMKVCDPPLPLGAIDELDPGDFDDMAMILVGFMNPARPGASGSGSPPAG